MTTSSKPTSQPAFGLNLPERYRVRRHIATGGMASVWSAEDRVLGRQVAIKVLSERFTDDPLAIRRFQREARAAARVSAHPHVVTIFDVGEMDAQGGSSLPRAFIVMEHLAGGTVADALHAQAVRPADARRWLREAAAAVDHANQRGIVHRDLKPANFLLDGSRSLHVADFGIARLQSEETITSSGDLFGTAAYLSPEQALGHDATAASDRYALAVAAFELLTGSRPFTANHFAAQARQHIEDQPPLASEREPSLPPAVDAVLTRAMAKDPEARYQTAGEFTGELEAALDDPRLNRSAQPMTSLTEAMPTPTGANTNPSASAAPRRGGRVGRVSGRPSPGAPTTSRRPLSNQHRGGGAVALAALAVVAIGVVVLLTQMNSSGGVAKRAARSHRVTTVASSHLRQRPTKPRAASSSRSSAAGASESSTSTAGASSTSTAGASSTSTAGAGSTPATRGTATAPPTDPAGLELQGHAQMVSGNYPAAIDSLRRALSTAPAGSLTYAYALYDLGRSLLMSGNASAAVPILQQRLKIPNQTPVVQALLNQALRATGQASPTASNGAAPIPPGHQPGHGHGGGHGHSGD